MYKEARAVLDQQRLSELTDVEEKRRYRNARYRLDNQYIQLVLEKIDAFRRG